MRIAIINRKNKPKWEYDKIFDTILHNCVWNHHEDILVIEKTTCPACGEDCPPLVLLAAKLGVSTA